METGNDGSDGILSNDPRPSGDRRVHAFGADALADRDATELAALIRAGELSSAEVVEAAVARAEQVQPHLNAIQVADFDRARAAAGRAAAGVFAGVPIFIKDNTDVAGLVSAQGSVAFRPAPAERDAPFAAALFGLGLINLGKTTLPEFGLNASTEFMTLPPTRNPWDPDYSCGASSGGSAALVAAGVVPIAHANDGGGSIRIPAACCGLIGLKPTRGRFAPGPTERVLPVNIISEGVLTRSVRDTAGVMAGLERQAPSRKLSRIGLVAGPSSLRLRIGVAYDSVNGALTDDDTRAVVTGAAQLLAGLGHDVAEVELTASARFEDDFGIYWGLLSFLLRTFGPQLFHADMDRAKLDGLTLGLAEHYRRHLRQTPGVIRRLRAAKADYAKLFDGCDVVLTPVLAHTTPRLGHLSPAQPFNELFDKLIHYVAFTPWNNASGGPALSLPMGVSREGLPVGVHLCASHGDERTLLELAFEIEAAAPWRRIQD